MMCGVPMSTTTPTAASEIAGGSAGELTLEQVAERLKEWRAVRRKGACIPEEYWREALRLARVHGVGPTCSALRLSPLYMQRRLAGGCAPVRPARRAAAFVEVAPPAAGDVAIHPMLELLQPNGVKWVLRASEGALREILPFLPTLLQARR
jgi:hypothetical protein